MAREIERIGRVTLGRADSLRQQIYQELRNRLQHGEVGPDERLVDVVLADELGVSRMPVREALLQLANEGYLVGTTRGFMLPRLTIDDIADIFEVRKLLEPRAAANAARDLDAGGDSRLEDALRRAENAVAKQDAVELAQANVAFRETWLGAVRNKRLASTISRFADHVQVVRIGTLGDRATQRVVIEGLRRLYDAFIRRDALAAQDRMAIFITEAERSFFHMHHEKAAVPEKLKIRTVKRKES